MKSIKSYRSLLLLALLAWVAAPTQAQVVGVDTIVTHRPKHFSIGLTAGIDRNYHITDLSYMNGYSYSPYAQGSAFGVQLGYSPWRWLTIRMDGVYLDKDYHRSHTLPYDGGSYPDTTSNKYVNVPLMVMLNVGKTIRLHAFGGVYGGYWLSSHRKGLTMGVMGNSAYDEGIDLDSEESQRKFNRKDGGFVYGAGVSAIIAKRVEIGADIRWYYGIYDIQKDYMMNLNPRYNTTMVMQAGVSYWF